MERYGEGLRKKKYLLIYTAKNFIPMFLGILFSNFLTNPDPKSKKNDIIFFSHPVLTKVEGTSRKDKQKGLLTNAWSTKDTCRKQK